jgi:pyruvate/2-oxoacid:ferredoxin oxidoreductase beta subunit
MKEQTLLEMKNKVETLGSVLTRMMQEMEHLRDLSIGTMELVKKFPDYDEAIEKLKQEAIEKQKEKETKLELEDGVE